VLRSILRVKFILVLIIELYYTDDEYTKTWKKQETTDYGSVITGDIKEMNILQYYRLLQNYALK